MKQHEPLDRLIAEESSQWLETLDRASARERRAFARWVLNSARHVRGFLLMTALDEELKHLDPQRRFTVGRVQEQGAAEIVPLQKKGGSPALPRPGSRAWAAGIAAGLAVVGVAAWYFMTALSSSTKDFTTAIGEQRTLELGDGSIVRLNTQSRLKVLISARARDIRLVEGEALFEVRRDPARPFRVYTADAVIQAVGTQFNVYRRPDSTLVSVLEGVVQISSDESPLQRNTAHLGAAQQPAKLAAGEEARIQRNGAIDRRLVADIGAMTAWQRRQLVFKQTALADVVREFNRYNRAPQFRVADAAIAARLYSGVFDADDPQSLTELLGRERDLSVERRGDEIVIRER